MRLGEREIQLKVCGMKDAQNIADLKALRPDYMGFIFYEKSRRYAGHMDPEIVPAGAVKKTGVFVNSSSGYIREQINTFGLQAVQLHGDEDPSFCAELAGLNIEVIKAFGLHAHFDFKTLQAYQGKVDFLLFDTASAERGGTGRKFDWQLLEKYPLEIPYFLSGGIDQDDRAALEEIRDERFYAIDINSRFETAPGCKDIGKIKNFINDRIKNIP